MKLNKNTLKFLIKEVIKETYQPEGEELDRELTWKKITDNLNDTRDKGFRLNVLKAILNANSEDPDFMADMFETLTKEEDTEVQQKIIIELEKIYKEEQM